jgi:hypothetical protein
MLQALLKGKLSTTQENMEDIMTSNVFGTFEHIPPHEGLLPFISLSKDTRDQTLNFLKGLEVEGIAYNFWPWWASPTTIGCEPDLVISLKTPDKNYMILVEAKLYSGKSSSADNGNTLPTDQLAREWDNLVKKSQGSVPILIYLTAEISIPKDDIDSAIREYHTKRPDELSPKIYWLSWRQLHNCFHSSRKPALHYLSMLASKLNLTFFCGIQDLPSSEPISWCFLMTDDIEKKVFSYDWALLSGFKPITWSFTQ